MKASSSFYALGALFFGAAAASLSFLKGTNAQHEARGEELVRDHPRYTFYCEHSSGDSVDQILSGHIAIFSPIVCESTQVVHVMAGEQLTFWSHGVLSASNVHFVVHENATLVLESMEGIELRRHESSVQALIIAVGKVVVYWPKRMARLFDDAAVNEDKFRVVRLVDGGMIWSQLEIKLSANSMVSKNTITGSPKGVGVWKLYKDLRPGQGVDVYEPIHSSTDDWDSDEEDVVNVDDESALMADTLHRPYDHEYRPRRRGRALPLSKRRTRGSRERENVAL